MRNTCWPHRMFPTDTLFRVFLSRAWSLSRGTVIRLGALRQLSMIPSFEKPCTYRPLRLSFCHSLVFGLAVDVLDHTLTACMSGLCQLLNNSTWPLCVCATAHGLSPTSRAAVSSYSYVLTLAAMPKHTFLCLHALYAFGFFQVPPFPLFSPAAETGRYNNFSVQNRRTTKLSNAGIKSTEVTRSLCESPVRDSPLGTRSVLTNKLSRVIETQMYLQTQTHNHSCRSQCLACLRRRCSLQCPLPPNSNTYSVYFIRIIFPVYEEDVRREAEKLKKGRDHNIQSMMPMFVATSRS